MTPCYGSFPENAEACANLTRRSWNPPIEVVARWLELCTPEGWRYRGLTRVICLEPHSIQQQGYSLDALRVYVSEIGEQLQEIANRPEGWQQMDKVDTIVIPI